MKLIYRYVIFFLFLTACSSQLVTKNPSTEILKTFDGYNWSWKCGDQTIQFTLWKENIRVTQLSKYWLIQGVSSDPADQSKAKSQDESGSVIIIYNAENNSIVNLIHGKQIPALPDIDSAGNVVNMINISYC